MKITFTKHTKNGDHQRSYAVNSIKYAGYLIAIDIVNVGWRTLTKDQYDTFIIENI